MIEQACNFGGIAEGAFGFRVLVVPVEILFVFEATNATERLKASGIRIVTFSTAFANLILICSLNPGTVFRDPDTLGQTSLTGSCLG